MRNNFVFGYIGINRCGKTTEAENIVKRYIKSRGSKAKVIAFDPQNRFGKYANFLIQGGDEKWATKLEGVKNYLLVLDDYKIINPQHQPVEGLANILSFREENNVDIIYITHNPRQVINIFCHYTTRWHIFQCSAQAKSFDDKMANGSLCITASNYINQYAQRFNEEQYKTLYPNFPHMVVDVKHSKLYGVNINRKL